MGDHTDLNKLSQALGLALQENRALLALAESCTGGLVAASITEIAGSSVWFDRGFVTYSNAAKHDMLGITVETLEEYGAVSEQTAIAMAQGARQHSQANITGSITGIAGPSGGSADKPVGTVCFAWTDKTGQATSITVHFSGNRQSVRRQAAITLMTNLIKLLQQR